MTITVLAADTQEPLADFELALHQPLADKVDYTCLTDALGQVTTPAIWSTGSLQFEGPTPDYEKGKWRLSPGAISIPPGESPQKVTLQATAVDAPLDVVVLRPEGKPLAGAQVGRCLGTFGGAANLEWLDWERLDTGEAGSARFFLTGEQRLQPLALFLFDSQDGLVSDVLMPQTPSDRGPHEIETYAGGSLSVRYTNPDGSPVTGAEILLRAASRLGTRFPLRLPLDEQGLAIFAPLAAGEYYARIRFDHSRRGAAERGVRVGRGEAVEVAWILDPQDRPRLAVAGDIIDEHGQPVPDVMLSVLMPDGSRQSVFGDSNGHFEHFDHPTDGELVLHAGASVFADVFEPPVSRVPFGTRGVVIRRVKRLEESVVLFELIDASSGLPLKDETDPAVILHLPADDVGRVHGVARFGLTDGVSEVDFKPHAGLRWYVGAPGYREARGELQAPGPGEDMGHLRVLLQRGFERTMVVRDLGSNDTVAGVRFVSAEGHNLGTSDAHGKVVLIDALWPAELLQVQAPGYRARPWNAFNYWSHHEAVVWLVKE